MDQQTETIIEKLQQNRNIFLTGGAGVGKTTMTRAIIDAYESEGKKVAKLASTGMAATLIGGQTLHSFLDLGIASNLQDLEQRGKVEIKKKTKKLIRSMALIVIDEISMVSAELLDMIRLRLLQAEYDGPVLAVGDFLQLPPVVRGWNPVTFAFEAVSWQKFEFETVLLEKIYRTSDEDFIKLLHAVRFGHIQECDIEALNELVKPISEDISTFTVLFGKNASAQQHNSYQLAQLEGDLFSFETKVARHEKTITDEVIGRFMEDARIPSVLELKIGTPVLFTRNAWNYFNGERGRVIRIENGFVYVQKADGYVVKLEQVATSKTQWKERTVEGHKEMVEVSQFTLHQYPIAPAFGITIHKSQGMSIEDLIIETNEIFAPSQFYVALSRAVSPHRLILIAPKRDWRQLAFVHQKAAGFMESISS
ncbi:MAG: DEAD/DEAH box helicase [Sulfurimonadaceae bacterium]|nr:DEAD/DEAH box helicase [Sulfurimonadaceae bacterium]